MLLIIFAEHIREFVAKLDQKLSFVDEIAVIAAIDPEVILKRVTVLAGVELSGKMTRSIERQSHITYKHLFSGQVTIDWARDYNKGNIHFITDYNAPCVDDYICAAFRD